MNKEISIDDIGELQIVLENTLGACSLAIADATNAAAKKVGNEAVKKLKSSSPVDKKRKRAKSYSKGWRVMIKNVRVDGSFEIKIYNATYGSLTHLLEKGHPIIKNGTTVGRAAPQPHIGPVNDWVQTEGFKQISDAVSKAVSNLKT